MTPQSPLTKSQDVKLVREISAADIINAYKAAFNVDVKRFFDGIEKVQLYKCLDTGYQFFFPFNITGDSKFYEHFQQYEWYYMDWKWEHETARKLIGVSDEVLEIGCGKGSFIECLTKENIHCAGLELNRDAVEICQKKGLRVFDETIWQHAENNTERYDVVCSFQVAEHIPDIKKFLQASLDVLKPHGKLIISVPNDDSFLGLDENNILNWPPHHMGLWNECTMKKLPNILRLNLQKLYTEPLQSYHYEYFIAVVSKNKRKYRRWGCLINAFSDSLIRKWVYRSPFKIKGFTMIGEYTKA